jgi:hypothetical protein
MATKARRRTDSASVRLLSIILLSLFLEACDEGRQATSAVDPDTELMNDIGTAGPELERRFSAA